MSELWDIVPVPRVAVKFPLSFEPGPDFDASKSGTWPDVPGRLELVGGRLQFMPPCGEEQAAVAGNVVATLIMWARAHPGFVAAGNEAGMLLGGEVRGADGAIWRSSGARRSTGFRRDAPLLAVEVSGQDEDEALLRRKAKWYLRHGVETVWIVLPENAEVVVLTSRGTKRFRSGRLAAPASLPGLTPSVAELFQ